MKGNEDLNYLLRLPNISGRVTRFYYYAWTGNMLNRKHHETAFDSGLIDPVGNKTRIGFCTYRGRSNPSHSDSECPRP